jgi:hypothetical protein
MVGIASPLLYHLYSAGKGFKRSLWNTFLVSICVLTLVISCVENPMKPLHGPSSIWGKDRYELISRGNPKLELLFRLIDVLQMEGLRMGVVPSSRETMIYPLFGRHFERRIIPIRVDRPELLDPAKLPPVDYLLFYGETQSFFLTNKADFSKPPWSGETDLHPLLNKIRDSKSTWERVVSVYGAHLFARSGLPINSTASGTLPDYLPNESTWWGDKWVEQDFKLSVRVDPAKPTLFIRGDMPTQCGPHPTLQIIGPGSQILGNLDLPGNGPFSHKVSLRPLIPLFPGTYASLEFLSSWSFNPKQLGISTDDRNLSWRLLELKLSSEPPDRPPDYRLISTWWSDKWVEDHFKVSIRVDPSRPILEVQGEMPSAITHPALKVVWGKRTLAAIATDLPGPFTSRIPLKSLLENYSGKYVLLEFISNSSFNPKKLGQSADHRDLSWRLYQLRLVEE